ncbi:MAG: hypothetical protein JSV04_07645 [Candidatus Heimdallarchaeota archaeon]|nr:MAG: hypothetical protein JSV04_07645 [Candidatus Heimdallarchaeota archaeon]
MNSPIDSNSVLEYFRPRGKIVCVGKDLTDELRLIHDFLEAKNDIRLPLLFLTSGTPTPGHMCDQVVIFDSETILSQIQSLLNSFFLIFIFNSSEEGIFRELGAILASIEFAGSVPIFIDTGKGLQFNQREIFGECYFHFDCSLEKGRWDFIIFLNSLLSSLSQSGFGVSFSSLIRIFGNSKYMFYGVSSTDEMDSSVRKAIEKVGGNLINALPEEIEGLEAILFCVTSSNPLSLKTIDDTTKQIAATFGKDFEIFFSNAIDSRISSYNIVLILTDLHPLERIIPNSASNEILTTVLPTIASLNVLDTEDTSLSETYEEDERLNVLSKIFSDTEVYIFNDGGLPLFASHHPGGQEACLYTGLFSAIQSMSSDLIGHTPDHLTAGDKRCVFVSQVGPQNSQLRGVAICTAGQEKHARDNLAASMDLVREFLEKGEPEYAVNDRIQGLLVKEFHNGSIKNIMKASKFHAS